VRIRRVEIRDFRKIGHVVIEDLADGLNVVVGDNEAGKSTLLAAIRAALFDRHRLTGDAADEMLPYGQKVRPEVALDFELGGKAWRLRKAFVKSPEAELVGPGERLTGNDVEDRLAELLGFVRPSKGWSKPEEHHGIYGLLWVEQGRAHEAPSARGARDGVAGALETEVGQIVGGERGRRLLDAAEKRRSDYWTTKHNKPRDVYAALIADKERLEIRRAELAEALAGLEDKVAELDRCRTVLARHQRERRRERAAQAVHEARAAMARIKELEIGAERAEAALFRSEAEHGASAEAILRRRTLAEAGEVAERDAARTDAEAAACRSRFERAAAQAEAAEARLAAARVAREALGQALRRREQAEARRETCGMVETLAGQLRLAEQAERDRIAAMAEVNACPVTRDDVASLERLDAELQRAIAQRDTASVGVAFSPDPGRRVTVDGAPHDAEAALRLSRDARLWLEGFGSLAIHPGGGVAERVRAVEAARRDLAERLAGLGVDSLDAARRHLERRHGAQERAASLRRHLASLAPDGLGPLRLSVETARARLLAADADDTSEDAATPTEALRRGLGEASATERLVEAEAAAQRALRERLGQDAARLSAEAAAASRAHEQRLRELAAERARQDDAAAALAADRATEALAAARAMRDEARAALRAADPDIAELALARAENAERQIAADEDKLTRDAIRLDAELDSLGRQGLGEEMAEAEGALERLERRLAETDLRARAARLLHDTLLEAERETKERWLGPIRDRAKPYLRLIHPDSDVVLDGSSLELKGFRRGDREEPFENLSVGAREQVAVITRLALADLLAAAGRPAAVILDDALVNTDETRLERMHLVLNHAAKSLQILILTCRERDFIALGAPIRRL
jgi:hypothetical protein